MSIKLIDQAWGTPLKGNDLLVLIALCDWANDDGECFPKQSTIVEKVKCSRSTLNNILNNFEEIGLIKREDRRKKSGDFASTLYKLDFNISFEKYTDIKKKRDTAKPKLGHANVQNLDTPNNSKLGHANVQNLDTPTILEPSIIEPSGKKNFSFTLKKISTIDEMNDDYLVELKRYIEGFILELENKALKQNVTLPFTLEYQEFIDGLLASGKKYKDFSATYRNWHRMGVTRATKRKAS